MTKRVSRSLYFPAGMLAEIKREAHRLGRSPSWILERAWTLAREKLMLRSNLARSDQPIDDNEPG